jgi:hypothetical protein
MQKARFLAVILVLFAFSAVQATVLWSNPDGSAKLFDWVNGQSLYGLFGDPILVGGDTLVFFPSMFRAESMGQTNSVSDRLEFELIAHPGFGFQNISITEFGDYGILGNGLVQASGALSVENMDTTDILNSDLITDLPSMFPDNDSGVWQGWSQLDIGPADWTHIKITLENNLLAVSGNDSAAWIEKKVLGDAIALQIIPEPATVAMLSTGAIFTLCHSSKRHKKT